jgi:hypothetical protein
MEKNFEQVRDLSRLKAFLKSIPNVDFVSESNPEQNFSPMRQTFSEMRDLDHKITNFIDNNCDNVQKGIWLVSCFKEFYLGNTFWMASSDFPLAPWVTVKVSDDPSAWLPLIWHNSTVGTLFFAPLDLKFAHEFRQQEHQLSCFSQKVGTGQ